MKNPKCCENCKYWEAFHDQSIFGYCKHESEDSNKTMMDVDSCEEFEDRELIIEQPR